MISNSNDVYSDEYQSKDENVELVRQLDDNDKFKTDNINNLEELLKKSRRLNNSITTRLIDEKLENLSNQKIQSIENLILSCNQIRISNQFNWTHLPKKLRSLDLSGNFLSSINEIEKENNQLESLALSFNEINQISDVFSIEKWSNLCLLDISYNMLRNLKETIESLKHLSKLRILYLHGNPLSLLVDYRIYVVNCLEKLIILDDIRITAEERFRSRTYSIIDRKDKDYALFQITFSTIENVPTPPINQNEWPLQIHRYKMRLDWFEEEEDIKEIDIPFDKMSNFKRFKKSQFESSSAEHKPNIDLSPNTFNLTINNVIPFRDFLFHGTKCQFIHQMTEYWSPDQLNQANDQKTKANSSKEKKSESPVKKKKIEDLSKLVTIKDPIETVLAEFHVELRPFLDGDYQVCFQYKSPIEQLQQQQQQQLTDSINQTKSGKQKDGEKSDPSKDKKRSSASKSNQDKTKDQSKDKKQSNANEADLNNLPQPLQCSIQFQLHRFVSEQQII
ncbi:unnamed protein product [Rotaria sordida]|uniref:Uncharacterized protein n=1 Tax=Rotaria sordida TaxID=392033 RepID=A0A819HIN6_9BILA|nr:unnamed protein product [Rotaria sordida]